VRDVEDLPRDGIGQARESRGLASGVRADADRQDPRAINWSLTCDMLSEYVVAYVVGLTRPSNGQNSKGMDETPVDDPARSVVPLLPTMA